MPENAPDYRQMEVQDVPRAEVPRCECPEHPCRNAADLDDEVVTSPALCVPCLYGCMP